MDPVSQGVLGAIAAQATCGRRARPHFGKVAVMGWLAGMAPDLDVLIRSAADPLLYLEFHRQFTHSLFFIPIGGSVVALLFWLLFSRRIPWRVCWIACVAGYATHGVLDACTTYGTQLLWPFADTRVAWNIISIVDPLFTVPLLVAFGVSLRLRRPGVAVIAGAFVAFYLALGIAQRERAEDFARRSIAERGHVPQRLEAKPSFGNILVWKIVYEWEDRFHVDAVRMGSQAHFFEGDSVRRLDVARDFPGLPPGSRQAMDIERFRWFSNDYLAVDPTRPDFVIDVRYSMVANEIDPLWGIRVTAETDDRHVTFEMSRDASQQTRERFWALLFPRSAQAQPSRTR